MTSTPAPEPVSVENPCPGCGEDLNYVVRGITYSLATSVEIRGVYDGGLFYLHDGAGCGATWHRWPEGHHLRERAEPYLQQWSRRLTQE